MKIRVATFISAILIIFLLVVAGCGSTKNRQGMTGSWQPPFVPLEITLDSELNITVSVNQSIVTPIGIFSVGIYSMYDFNNPEKNFGASKILIVRLEQKDYIYALDNDKEFDISFTKGCYKPNIEKRRTYILVDLKKLKNIECYSEYSQIKPGTTDVSQPENFGQLFFCSENEFDKNTNQCITSRNVFSGIVKIIYVSWVPPDIYVGKPFTRKWYLNGVFFLSNTTLDNYAYLEVSTRNSLAPGFYHVELYVDDKMVQSGNFTIE